MAGSIIVSLVLAYFVATASAVTSCSTQSGNIYACTAASRSGTQCAGGVGTFASSSGCTTSGFFTAQTSGGTCQCAPNCAAYPSTPFEYNATLYYPSVGTSSTSSCATAQTCLTNHLYGNAVSEKCVPATSCQLYNASNIAVSAYGDSVLGNCVASCPTVNGDNAPYLDPTTNICESLTKCNELTPTAKYVNLFAGTCITSTVCSQFAVSNGVHLVAANNVASPQGQGNYCQCPSASVFADYESNTCNTAAQCLDNLSKFGDPTSDSCVGSCPNGLYGDADNDAYEGLCVTQTQCASIGKFTDTSTGQGLCVVSTSCTSPLYADPTSNTCVEICSNYPYIYVNQTTNECSTTAPTVPILYYTVTAPISDGDIYTQIPETNRDCLKYDTPLTFTPGYTIFSYHYGAKLCCSEIGFLDLSSNPQCQQAKCGASVPVDGNSVDNINGTEGSLCFGNCYLTSQSPDPSNQYNLENEGNNPFYFTHGVIAATGVSDPKAGYAVTNRNGLNSGWVVTYGTKRRSTSTVLCLIKGSVSGTTCEYATCAGSLSGTETSTQGYFSYNNAGTEECYLRCYGH